MLQCNFSAVRISGVDLTAVKLHAVASNNQLDKLAEFNILTATNPTINVNQCAIIFVPSCYFQGTHHHVGDTFHGRIVTKCGANLRLEKTIPGCCRINFILLNLNLSIDLLHLIHHCLDGNLQSVDFGLQGVEGGDHGSVVGEGRCAPVT